MRNLILKSLLEAQKENSNIFVIYSATLEVPESLMQTLYRPIYSFSLIKLEMLKTFIKSHPKGEFVQPSNSRTRAPILFYKKSDSNFIDN